MERLDRVLILRVADIGLRKKIIYVGVVVLAALQIRKDRNRFRELAGTHVTEREIKAGRILVDHAPTRGEQMRNGFDKLATLSQLRSLLQFLFSS